MGTKSIKLSELKPYDLFILKDVSNPKSTEIYVKYFYSHRFKMAICYKLSDKDVYCFFRPTKKVYKF